MKVRFILSETATDTGITEDIDINLFKGPITIIYKDEPYVIDDILYSIDQSLCFVRISPTVYNLSKVLELSVP